MNIGQHQIPSASQPAELRWKAIDAYEHLVTVNRGGSDPCVVNIARRAVAKVGQPSRCTGPFTD